MIPMQYMFRYPGFVVSQVAGVGGGAHGLYEVALFQEGASGAAADMQNAVTGHLNGLQERLRP